ncbi:hypothetical protein [Sinorhizobium sp. BG8]|uniref:hypothetical protein n=1 Tax=Sinorhizobium sp. BG8 TaxID=2613773 RepID=UPI00193D12A4|nr:hypothetical protein [Sinorhizobium sp. BG8]QRM55010.1 hypothetical protein F3Y30_11010 [Sinorhizobium sp. BG8]
MPRLAVALTLLLSAVSAASAQDIGSRSKSGSATMAQLIAEGYEIKAAAPNGSRYVVFMQKEKSAYACEFANVSATQCRLIN